MENIGRSVFGQKISLPDITHLALEQELLNYASGDVFKVTNGDPNYMYLWPIDPRKDAKTRIALQHGVYEPVTTSNEPNLVTHAQTRIDGEYMFLNEHILCRMTKDRWNNRQTLRDYENLKNERRITDEYQAQAERLGHGQIDPTVTISEQTRVATSWE